MTQFLLEVLLITCSAQDVVLSWKPKIMFLWNVLMLGRFGLGQTSIYIKFPEEAEYDFKDWLTNLISTEYA